MGFSCEWTTERLTLSHSFLVWF